MAFITNLDTGVTKNYKLNEIVMGARIIEIKPGRVMLVKNGLRKELLLRSNKELGIENEFPLDEEVVVTAASPGQMLVSRPGIIKQIEKANELLAKVRISPVPDEGAGKLRGFRIDNVPSGSIIEQAGIKSRDIVCSVASYKLESTQAALDVFAKIRNKTNVEVNLLRDGKPVTLFYKIKER